MGNKLHKTLPYSPLRTTPPKANAALCKIIVSRLQNQRLLELLPMISITG